MATVLGVSKDEPREVNEKGASQSRSPYRFDLLDPSAMFEMTKVLKEGADKYGVDNWRGISVRDHLNHLLIHAYAYLAGDNSDDHLSHLMCRAMFALAVDIDEKSEVKLDSDWGDPYSPAVDTPSAAKPFKPHNYDVEFKEGPYFAIDTNDVNDLRFIKDPIYEITNNLATAYIKLCENFSIVPDQKIQNKTGGFKGGD